MCLGQKAKDSLSLCSIRMGDIGLIFIYLKGRYKSSLCPNQIRRPGSILCWSQNGKHKCCLFWSQKDRHRSGLCSSQKVEMFGLCLHCNQKVGIIPVCIRVKKNVRIHLIYTEVFKYPFDRWAFVEVLSIYIGNCAF